MEKEMAPHSSTLAWKIPQTEEPGGLQSMGSQRVGHDWATSLSLSTFMHCRRKWQTHSSVLAWRIPGTGEPGGLPSVGSHGVGHDWSNLAAAAATAVRILRRSNISFLASYILWIHKVPIFVGLFVFYGHTCLFTFYCRCCKYFYTEVFVLYGFWVPILL